MHNAVFRAQVRLKPVCAIAHNFLWTMPNNHFRRYLPA
ncbi:hypothetical protein PAMC26510_13175 [Caballeronia sordidicola]|uniref:Uncharacterized protein n=1 Tax=Caballeronia sordidicola TaxID=196367 RepID=A0A242MWB9_CABSO|nr:hypothetical protein PAMC26510_13175 [Caballeronia sordidicola]